MSETFADKLRLVLKVLVVSRTGLASALNVDKSLVGRWASGTVKPSEHNLANITRYVAARVPGFTLLDWERDIKSFGGILGVRPDGSVTLTEGMDFDWVAAPILDEALRTSKQRGGAYEGLWRSTRASNDLPGRFVHDICMMQRREDGMLQFKVGVEGVRYVGWSLLLQHQIFSVASDVDSGTMMFSIFNGVARQRPEVLDGLNLATLRDAGGSPAASASVLHRIGDLTGNPAQDEKLFEEAITALDPLASEGSVPEKIANHLTRNVTDCAPGFLRLLYGQSVARGTKLGKGPPGEES